MFVVVHILLAWVVARRSQRQMIGCSYSVSVEYTLAELTFVNGGLLV